MKNVEIEFEDEIVWDGECLSVWARILTRRVLCEIPRDTVHQIRFYSDAISREISKDRRDIVHRLKPIILAKLERAEGHIVRIQPSDAIGI